MKINPVQLAYAAAGLGGLYVAWKLTNAAGAGAAAVAGAAREVVTVDLNPAASGNVVNRAVSAAGAAVSGDSSWSLGGWLAGVTGADRDAEIRAMLTGTTAATSRAAYAKPPTTSGAPSSREVAPLSFLNTGGSFKDLSDPATLNPYALSFAYGGGLDLGRNGY